MSQVPIVLYTFLLKWTFSKEGGGLRGYSELLEVVKDVSSFFLLLKAFVTRTDPVSIIVRMGRGGIQVKKVICVAPGHKKCRILVFLSVAYLRFLFKGLLAIKRDSPISKIISLKNIYIYIYILVFPLSRRNAELEIL